eukprot:TRINITY_DN1776_c0_g1_i1.p1 TRINITY_DN1776_c0_g1~~TRINITY_DN1776_c0_g1_i1.p1  ORF type:complete len:509 (+),score=155.10 TRINITY_DN1776_c0_g1_i1:107-1633(+)
MAQVAEIQIARDQFQAKSAQAALEAEVHRQGRLQAELSQSIARQKALEASSHGKQAERGKEVAMEKLRYAESDLQERKIHILLQAFDAILDIFQNVEVIAALLLKFTELMLDSIDVTKASTVTKRLLWGSAAVTAMLLMHSVFQATLAAVDSTKLAYQGTHGIQDIIRAFHGLMSMRSSLFWNFVSGFMIWNLLVVGSLWTNLDNDVGPDGAGIDKTDLHFGITVTGVFWALPMLWMWWTWRKTRRLFSIDSRSVLSHAREGNIDRFELALGPQSVRKAADRAEDRREHARRRGSASGSVESSPQLRPRPASWREQWAVAEERFEADAYGTARRPHERAFSDDRFDDVSRGSARQQFDEGYRATRRSREGEDRFGDYRATRRSREGEDRFDDVSRGSARQPFDDGYGTKDRFDDGYRATRRSRETASEDFDDTPYDGRRSREDRFDDGYRATRRSRERAASEDRFDDASRGTTRRSRERAASEERYDGASYGTRRSRERPPAGSFQGL